MQIFFERLKFERSQQGYTQESFAKKLGISRGTYSHYEANTSKGRQPPFELVCQIATILDVSVDYLFGLED